MINSYTTQQHETLEINDVLYNIMPSDISLFSDNAIQEDVYFRSKGAFAFRSKKSKSKIILTLPIPLLDSGTLEKYSEEEQELFTNGLKVLGELNAFPFCFVKSTRIYSYLGVTFKTPHDYLMFGVEELKIVQDQRVPGVLFAEITLLFNNQMNLVKDMNFRSQLTINRQLGASSSTLTDTVDNPIFNKLMDSLAGPSLTRYNSLLQSLGIRGSSSNFDPSTLLTNVGIKVPHLAGADELIINDARNKLALDIRSEDLSKIDYTDFKMYDRFTASEGTFDGGVLQDFQGSIEDDLAYIKNPAAFQYDWRMYYLKDKYIYDATLNAIQSVTFSKRNIFASHHVGSSQHPYLQYMGKVPARLSITSVYNNSGSYEFNDYSTMALFRIMLGSIDTINSQYPGANSVNFIKINSVATEILGINNFIPGECVLTSSGDVSNLETFTASFIENSMDKMVEESKIRAGKDVVNSASLQRASKVILDYAQALHKTLKAKEPMNFIYNIEIMGMISELYTRIDKERIGGTLGAKVQSEFTADGTNVKEGEVLVDLKVKDAYYSSIKDGGQGASKEQTKAFAVGSSAYYAEIVKTRPSTSEGQRELLAKLVSMTTSVVALLNVRESLNRYHKGEIKDYKGYGQYFVVETGQESTYTDKNGVTHTKPKTETKSLDEIYTFDYNADLLANRIYQTLVLTNDDSVSSLVSMQTTKSEDKQVGDYENISNANDAWLNNFTGDAQRDLSFDLYEPDPEIRKHLDPFFFLETTPILSAFDFSNAYNMLDSGIFKTLKEAITLEVGEAGVLDGGSSHAHELIAELAELKEMRYAPVSEAGERAEKNLGGDSGGFLGISNIGSTYSPDSLGSLSAKYEGKVGSANKDNEGWAYGKYQFNSKNGGLDSFFLYAPEYAAQFKGLTAGTAAFNNKWISIANSDTEAFEKAQDAAGKKIWYTPAIIAAKAAGLDVNNRGVQEAVYSASIQHGKVISGVITPTSNVSGIKNMSAEQQIQVLYAKRRAYVNGLSTVSAADKAGLMKRYDKELADALAIAKTGTTTTKTNVNNSSQTNAVNTTTGSVTKNAMSSNQTNQSTGVTSYPYAGDPKENYTTKVIVKNVVDTDTLTVQSPSLNKGKPFNIRAAGIDAPEAKKNNKGTNQYWAPESINALKLYVNKGTEMKITFKGTKDVYDRPLATMQTISGINIGNELIKNGHVLSAATNTEGVKLQQAAKAASKGMWADPDKIVNPSAYRAEEKRENGTKKAAPSTSVTTDTASFQKALSGTKTNKHIPMPASKGPYRVSSEYGWRFNDTQFHRAIDIVRKTPGTINGEAVLAPTSGRAMRKTQFPGAGNYVVLELDAQGFSCNFFHLSSFHSNVPKNGWGRINKGDILGYVGGTGKPYAPHLHYGVKYDGIELHPFMTADLDTIPKNQSYRPGDYIHPQAFQSHSVSRKKSLNNRAGTEKLALKILGQNAMHVATGASAYNEASEAEPGRIFTPEEIRGYTLVGTELDSGVSVFDNELKLEKHREKMFSNIDCGMNIAFPVFKGYATVGNEDDEFYFQGTTLRTANYFELPNIQEFHLSTNNDFNPIDICTFSLMNPSSIRTIPEDFGLDGTAKSVQNIDTQYYSLFYGNALKLRPGMKVQIRGGYSNNPNKLHIVFNGIIKEVSGQFDAKLNLVCESYGSELVNNTIGFERPVDMSKRKNASTGLLIGYSLLEENINHFGAQMSRTRAWWEWFGSIFPSWSSETEFDAAKLFDGKEDNIVAGKGRAGDFRDPENKALVSPFNMGEFLWNAWNPSRANLSQRLYTNIYSDAIEAVHDQYKSSFWTRYSQALSWDSEVYYSYWAFRSSTWSVIKEMEYRHPGTLAKPLWYEERQTMFFGTKEQLYVARDLDPSYMFSAGEAVRYTDLSKPYAASYMSERHKRLKPATGFHLLSSKLNILNNDMGFSRSFSTKVNVIYYEDKYEGNMVNTDSDTETIVLDKGLKSFDIRDKTIALNGCHEKYMAWLYGIQELKKQAETMYVGTITVTGKPDMRAGDYAYIEDGDRGMSGVIKIRECEHHYSQSAGYITTITPGLFVECTQFLWDTFFIQMGMASKMTLLKADLTATNILTSNQLAQDYLEYLKVIQGVQNTSGVDKVFGVGGSILVASVVPFLTYNMLKNSSILGIDPLSKAYKLAASLTKDFNKYVSTSAKARLTLMNTKKTTLITEAKNAYYNARATINTSGTLRWGSKEPDRIVKLAHLAMRGFKATGRLPVSALKLISGRSAMTVIGTLFNTANKLKSVIMANPIGFVLGVVLEMCIGFVMSKFKKLELTHNPLLLFPINYNGKPYISGISGFTNRGVLETMVQNIRENVLQLRKASVALDSVSEGGGKGAFASGAVNSLATVQNGVANVAEGLSNFLGS